MPATTASTSHRTLTLHKLHSYQRRGMNLSLPSAKRSLNGGSRSQNAATVSRCGGTRSLHGGGAFHHSGAHSLHGVTLSFLNGNGSFHSGNLSLVSGHLSFHKNHARPNVEPIGPWAPSLQRKNLTSRCPNQDSSCEEDREGQIRVPIWCSASASTACLEPLE